MNENYHSTPKRSLNNSLFFIIVICLGIIFGCLILLVVDENSFHSNVGFEKFYLGIAIILCIILIPIAKILSSKISNDLTKDKNHDINLK